MQIFDILHARLQLGELQQYAGPKELYDAPENLFAAGFIGVPSINQLRGRLNDGAFRTGGTTIHLPEAGDIPEERDLILAFRAEAVLLCAEGEREAHFAATVDEVYSEGRDTLIRMSVGGSGVRAFAHEDANLSPGETACLRFKNRGVFLFDAETGVRYA